MRRRDFQGLTPLSTLQRVQAAKTTRTCAAWGLEFLRSELAPEHARGYTQVNRLVMVSLPAAVVQVGNA